MTAMHELHDVAPRQIWDGVTARLVEGERMTVAIVEVGADQVVPQHTHDNEQIGFVIRGTIRFTIGDETKELGSGGLWAVPSNVPHSAAAGPDGAVVAEAYAPVRADWAGLPLQPTSTPAWPGA